MSTLKARLNDYIRIASGGETVIITHRDRVVAELIPPRETRGAHATNSALADLVHQGFITPAILGPGPPPEPTPVAPLADLVHELDEDRNGR